MPRLDTTECYRRIGPVDIGPVLSALDRLQFVAIGQSGKDMYKCDVAIGHFPPELTALLAGLGLGGETARAVVRKLKPRQAIPPHTDIWMPQEADWRRFQVPLVTDPAVVMRWPDDGIAVHLEAGNLYEVRFDRLHSVENDWDGERIHLQVDQIGATV